MGVLPFLLIVLGTGGSLLAWLRGRSTRLQAEQAIKQADERLGSNVRLLRLAAGELRGVSLALIGHSQTSGGGTSSPAAHLAARLAIMSETLLSQTDSPGAVRRLVEETVLLQPALEFAIAQVAAGLGPGQRAWRIEGVSPGTSLRADKRALNHILVNVLSGAAASTRDGDGIHVSLRESEAGLMLRIEDEGAGLPVAEPGGHESRGVGYGLSLARSLMQAHGGRLEVESLAKIGTRVSLLFPADRSGELD